ncbi:MAG TPA: thiol peroxidase, partial [Saprospiraceae bacterium]|nr:thiol peroxidase [Saprospiraceae bacterium]
MEKNNVSITFKGNPMTLLGHEIKVGQKAPNFTGIGSSLNQVTLED